MSNITELQATIAQMTARGKGLLAADESVPTITKRLQAIGVESTEETRRVYRDMLLTAPQLNEYISGVILFEETLNQTALDGTPFAKLLNDRGIVPGIKVDKGLIPLNSQCAEQVTQGLDGLGERLQKYKAQGARFAKWRAVYSVGDNMPSKAVNALNAVSLARYAAICQDNGIVPIVEPEVLIDGDHTIEQCEKASTKALHKVFSQLYKQGVKLEYIILKPSMVIAGKKCAKQSSVQEVAEATMRVLKNTVPATVPSINFLSGGQTPEQATAHLQAMNAMGNLPWHLSFSYARALQEPCMNAWLGKTENKLAAQAVLCQ
jgi:fructose-bisphosphate aldolase class I